MRKIAAATVVLMAFIATALPSSPASAAGATALIQGSGSSWAANAVEQWIADVSNNGLQVVFTPSGSAQGRKDFANKVVDFAISDIGYQGTDPATGQDDTSDGRSYAYLPIVAGGTSLPYQLRRNGQLITNLRLSGETVAKIFTNQITNWDDPEITADNDGVQMPNLRIIPVVHSEGSGSSYQFTRYLWREYPSIWVPFGGNFATEYFPRQGDQVAENGSDGVMNFLTSAAANGAIAFDEYSYALAKGYPVAKLLNTAGYYTLPNQYNVAVSLTKAVINMDQSSPDYLLQDLDDVYTYNDPRVYPMSSYSYAIIPIANNDATMTTAKRQTLVDYLDFSVCGGQQQMGPIGYSPLPINLVEASFAQVSKLQQADSGVTVPSNNVAACHNPTFIAGQPTKNYLAEIAPLPPSCDKQGQGPCTAGQTAQQVSKGTGGSGGSGGTGGSGTGSSTSGTGGSSHTSANATTGATNCSSSSPASGSTTSPSTTSPSGSTTHSKATSTHSTSPAHSSPSPSPSCTPTGSTDALANGSAFGDSGGGNNSGGGSAQPASTVVADSQSGSEEAALGVIAALMLIGLLLAPPLVARALARKGKT